mgnify:CR=1 FL=1
MSQVQLASQSQQQSQQSQQQVSQAVDVFPRIRISELREIYDRMLLIGPPGIGKTERLNTLSIFEAYNIARSRGLELRFWCEYIDPGFCRERYRWVCSEVSDLPICKERYEPPPPDHSFVFVDVRDLLSFYEKDSYAVKDLIKRMVSSPQNFYLYQRIIAPHLRPEDIQIPNLRKTDVPGISFDVPSPLALMTIPGVHGLLFIDEITNLPSPVHASMYFSIIQEREIGLGNKLSDKIKIVAAGNPASWSTAAVTASTLPEPLINRMVVYYILPPTVEEWIEYMSKRGILNEAVMVYLSVNRDALLASEQELEKIRELENKQGEPINFNSPRSWTILSSILNTPSVQKLVEDYRRGSGNEASVAEAHLRAIVYGTIGPIRGREFLLFLKASPDDPKEILSSPESYLRKYNDSIMSAEASNDPKAKENASFLLSKLIVSLFHLGKYAISRYAEGAGDKDIVPGLAKVIALILERRFIKIIPEAVTAVLYGILSYKGPDARRKKIEFIEKLYKDENLKKTRFFIIATNAMRMIGG